MALPAMMKGPVTATEYSAWKESGLEWPDFRRSQQNYPAERAPNLPTRDSTGDFPGNLEDLQDFEASLHGPRLAKKWKKKYPSIARPTGLFD